MSVYPKKNRMTLTSFSWTIQTLFDFLSFFYIRKLKIILTRNFLMYYLWSKQNLKAVYRHHYAFFLLFFTDKIKLADFGWKRLLTRSGFVCFFSLVPLPFSFSLPLPLPFSSLPFFFLLFSYYLFFSFLSSFLLSPILFSSVLFSPIFFSLFFSLPPSFSLFFFLLLSISLFFSDHFVFFIYNQTYKYFKKSH